MEISVIITNYNYGKYLSRAIRSAINQSFDKNEYEIIVIDDSSIDDSFNIANTFEDKIKLVQNNKNVGLATSCNIAIKMAMGTYVRR